MSSLMKMSRILGTLIIAALVVPAISSTMLVQNAYAFLNQAPALNPIGDNQTNVNRPPVLEPIGDNQTNEGQLLQFIVTASDPDNDNLTYSASNLPDGATFNVSIDFPTFSWIPGYDQEGDHEVQFEVSDGYLSDSENITITVFDANGPPVIESVTADPDRLWPPNHKHVDVTIMIHMTDPDGDEDIESATYTYSVTDEYGIYDIAGAALPEDGVISLVAERYGEDKDGRVYVITVTAYDAGGLSNRGSVEILVPHDQGKKSRTATAYRAGELSDGGNADVVTPHDQGKKGKKGKSLTDYDPGEPAESGNVHVVVPDDKSKKGKKPKSGK